MQDLFIEARNISKTYARKQALHDVSLSIPSSSIYGLLGPNGAGKTTFIRILTQIIGPDTGQILINGRPLKREDIALMGYMPEERGLYKKMRVSEQVLYLARLKGIPAEEAQQAMQYWFKALGIYEWQHKKVEELSKGMQQKIQFVVTVIHRPQLIILDEPFSGFDPVNAEMIKEQIHRLKDAGATIVLSTHRMESVEELCDNIALINDSQKILEGSVDNIRHQYKEHLYEVMIKNMDRPERLKDIPGIDLLLFEEPEAGLYHLRFRLPEGTSANMAIAEMMQIGELISFREVLPSIHDIFIKLVKKAA